MIHSLYSPNDKVYLVNKLKSPATIFADFSLRETAFGLIGIDASASSAYGDNKDIRFESRKGYDYAAIHMLTKDAPHTEQAPIELYVTKDYLVIFAKREVATRLAEEFRSSDEHGDFPAPELSSLFGYILKQGNDLLEGIDDRIESLEERSTRRTPEDHSAEIIALRKQILALKRYFGSMFDLLEDLDANENKLFSDAQLQSVRIHKNKANRLLNTVINLGDYLTQVREALQNQLDISLNETMRFFTVITAVFLPLTLVVGWYGMNLKMPELHWEFTYPIVIVVSLIVIVVSLVYCKKKGWF